MTDAITPTIEQLRDDAHRAADEARARLEEAQAACNDAERRLDGSDAAAREWTKAKTLLERRQHEFKNLEHKFQTIEREIASAKQSELHALYERRRAEADFKKVLVSCDALANDVLEHAVALQRAVEKVKQMSAVQRAAVESARAIGAQLADAPIVSSVEEREAVLAFGQRLARRALDLGVVLSPFVVSEPRAFRRVGIVVEKDGSITIDGQVHPHEVLVPVDSAEQDQSRLDLNTWRRLEEFFGTRKP